MNLLRAVVLPAGEGVELDSSAPGGTAGAARVRLGVPQRERLARLTGGRVLVGLRPEDIHLRAGADLDAGLWKGTIAWVEWLGCESVVCVRVGGQELLVRARSDAGWVAGVGVGVAFDPATVHGFRVEDGQRLF
jgi:ABC-type sugar transport system ATPase subunit